MHELHRHEPAILEIRLNRPPVNALDSATLVWLTQQVRAAPGQGHRAIVISGQPGMFTAGLDVPDLLTRDRAGMRQFFFEFFGTLRALGESEIPIVAAITGHAPAGGTVIAALCDHRVMARGAFKMGFNEHRVGLPVPRPVYVAFERLCGPRLAAEYSMQARILDGAEALAIGLVDELADSDQVIPAALAWCRTILAFPSQSVVAETRRYVRAGLVEAFRTENTDAETFLKEWFSAETQGAMKALIAKLKAKR
jgi:enoyl-CoA hydratase/carnithine racemase